MRDVYLAIELVCMKIVIRLKERIKEKGMIARSDAIPNEKLKHLEPYVLF